MYIFGYGSLINSASRRLTGQTGRAIPASATGLVRYFGKIDDSYILSPLVVHQGDGQINGVLLEIDEVALAEFDRRERGYQRIALTADRIHTQEHFDPEKPIWIYVTEQHQPPCSQSPIVQTYVDTVLSGCLEFSEAFARQFVEQTLGWQHPLDNDRHAPKYGNLAGVKPEQHGLIDQLIATVR